MSPAMKNPALHAAEEPVAAPPPAPYTAAMGAERNGARGGWREGARVWIPVTAIALTVLIGNQAQMLGMQRQIGDLRVELRDVVRAELRTELGVLRKDLEGQIGSLRAEVGSLREEVGALRAGVQALGDRVHAVEERMTSLETVVQTHLREHARSGSSVEGAAGRSPAVGAD